MPRRFCLKWNCNHWKPKPTSSRTDPAPVRETLTWDQTLTSPDTPGQPRTWASSRFPHSDTCHRMGWSRRTSAMLDLELFRSIEPCDNRNSQTRHCPCPSFLVKKKKIRPFRDPETTTGFEADLKVTFSVWRLIFSGKDPWAYLDFLNNVNILHLRNVPLNPPASRVFQPSSQAPSTFRLKAPEVCSVSPRISSLFPEGDRALPMASRGHLF